MAQDWPHKPVSIINPYGPGSTTDLLGRLIGEQLQKRTGQPFIVESRAGAGGLIGTHAIARAEPDGYSFGLSIAGPLAHDKLLRKSIPYDPLTDLTPLTLAVQQPNLFVAPSDIDAETLPELLAKFKQNPGKYNYALVGTGSLSHLLMIQLLEDSQSVVEPIIYPGGADALVAVMRGDVQITCLPAFIALAQAKAGKVKVLGISSKERSPFMPDVPTLTEQGYPNVVGSGWIAAVVSSKTPASLVDTMSEMVVDALNQPEVVKTLGNNMIEVIASTPAEYQAFIREEIDRWEPVIRRNDLVGKN